jgi:DNA-binding MarR family transcriptional regulator
VMVAVVSVQSFMERVRALMDSDTATLLLLVEQPEKADYVERVPDPTDGRARLVRPTPRLRRVAQVADAQIARVLAEWADHVGEDGLQQRHETLRDLREITDPWWYS